jgi:hypothetical protein
MKRTPEWVGHGGRIDTPDALATFLVSFVTQILAAVVITSWWCVADGWCSVLPAHSYVYTFEPNPEWSSFYAGSAEIQGYLQKVADKYSAGRFIKLSHKVTSCVWDSQKLKWYGEYAR